MTNEAFPQLPPLNSPARKAKKNQSSVLGGSLNVIRMVFFSKFTRCLGSHFVTNSVPSSEVGFIVLNRAFVILED